MNKYTFAACCCLMAALWANPASGQEMPKALRCKLPGFGACFVSFAGDGKSVACGFFPPPQNPQAPRRFTAITWDLAAGKETRRFEFPQAHALTFQGALSPDGKTLLMDVLGSPALFDAGNGKKLRELEGGGYGRVGTFTPDGRSIVGYWQHNLQVWSVAGDKRGNPFGTARGFPRKLAVSADGRIIRAQHMLTAKGKDQHTLCLWDVATGKEIWSLPQTNMVPISFGTWGNFSSATGGWDDGFRVRFSPTGLPFFTPPTAQLPILARITPQGSALLDLQGKKIRDLAEANKSFVADVIFSPSGRHIALLGCNWPEPTVSEPSSETLIYDLSEWTARERAAATRLTVKQLDSLWADLASADDARTHRALFVLRLLPKASLMTFLQRHVRTMRAPDPRDIARWIDDLDNSKIEVRQQATARLKGLGLDAAWALRVTQKRTLSLEHQRRIEKLLKEIEVPTSAAPTPRGLRVLDLLEEHASSEAIALVETLARGTPGAWLTAEAQATSRRLRQQDRRTHRN